ncbi:DUF1294 domain-containing protein [Stutzerimonas azotifigens]|uniref:DUF1294 domain-containing protein n=1 Tax=Stutzerimonas azotifigens TaxID=291995 RepID=A0ABR5Z6S2_9GAMM|nr:cold shock and DUF1294 domain-containing protein [Stutzerimonas azotifigens]MBA1275835.1 DUF1294 domain-containing protein [Stutzerimonas azotifigens]
MEQRGILKSWNEQKGFGFIRPQSGGAEVFVHISSVRGDRRPVVGDRVLFVGGRDEKGRLRAEHMRLDAGLALDQPAIRRKPRAANASKPSKEARRSSPAAGVRYLPMKLVVFTLLCALPLWGGLQPLLAGRIPVALSIYGAASLVTFLLYWRDKHSAMKDRWRTPESRLHLFELIGGWPGALVAQQLLRHKTRKLSFQLPFWFIVLAHQTFWIDLLFLRSAFGAERLRPLLGL